MVNTCPKCGGQMETGIATAYGLLGGGVTPKEEPRLQFVIPGEPTSLNPIKAFKQGLSDQQSNRGFWIEGMRCSQCGLLELFARKEAAV